MDAPQIFPFAEVEPYEEFISADGRVYMKGGPADPQNGCFMDTEGLGIRPSHVPNWDEPQEEFGEYEMYDEDYGDTFTVREFEASELVILRPFATRRWGRARFRGMRIE